ncbi:MAG: hypothetical protein GDA56_06350 [Hormoscilla sp. GM7CHS1pb]|nr:hypothetical protein [Hormoscilla sp. GM7CHS1pb]
MPPGGSAVLPGELGDRPLVGAATIVREAWHDRRSLFGAKKNIRNPQVWNWKQSKSVL